MTLAPALALAPAEAPSVKVGDFFVDSWGYDQTNVDFYRVVGMTPSGKSVRVQKWSMADTSEGGIHDSVVATEEGGPVMVPAMKEGFSEEDYWAADFWEKQEMTEKVPSPVETKRLQSYGSGASTRYYFRTSSFSSASQWDGRPKYQTGHGYGH